MAPGLLTAAARVTAIVGGVLQGLVREVSKVRQGLLVTPGRTGQSRGGGGLCAHVVCAKRGTLTLCRYMGYL